MEIAIVDLEYLDFAEMGAIGWILSMLAILYECIVATSLKGHPILDIFSHIYTMFLGF